MNEGAPKKESKSKNHSKHTEWEAKDMVLMIPLFPIFLLGALFDDLF